MWGFGIRKTDSLNCRNFFSLVKVLKRLLINRFARLDGFGYQTSLQRISRLCSVSYVHVRIDPTPEEDLACEPARILLLVNLRSLKFTSTTFRCSGGVLVTACLGLRWSHQKP